LGKIILFPQLNEIGQFLDQILNTVGDQSCENAVKAIGNQSFTTCVQLLGSQVMGTEIRSSITIDL